MKYKILDLCKKITSGGTPSRAHPEYYNNGSIFWLKTQELNNNKIYRTGEMITNEGLINSSAKLLPIHTVILAMYGATAGNLGLTEVELCTNQACANMIVNYEKTSPQFLFYSLLFNKTKILQLAIGAAQQNLCIDTIANFEIEVPDLQKQRHIVNSITNEVTYAC